MISSTMPSAKYSCSGSPLMFWNGSTAMDGLSGSGSGIGGAVDGFAGSAAEPDGEDAHRPGDVLDLLLAQILERDIELVADFVAHDPADADAARLGQPFQPRRDIDAVAEDVAVLDDDVAQVDADAELDAPVLGTPAFRSAIPRCTSTAQRTASTTLANSTSSPSPVVLTMRPRCSAIFGSLSSRRIALKRGERAFLVPPHQPRVAGDIRRQYRSQPALHPLLAHLLSAGEKKLRRVEWNLPLCERWLAGGRFDIPGTNASLPFRPVICGAGD